MKTTLALSSLLPVLHEANQASAQSAAAAILIALQENGISIEDANYIQKDYIVKSPDIKRSERAVILRVSTGMVDYDGDVMLQDGCLTKYYNNAVLFCHKFEELPIGKAIWTKVQEGDLLAKMVFAKHSLAEDLYQMYTEDIEGTGPIMSGWSVGFIPVEVVAPRSKDWEKYLNLAIKARPDLADKVDSIKRIITKWILLEFSSIPVGANPEARTIMVAKGYITEKDDGFISSVESKQISIDDLDDGETITVITENPVISTEDPPAEDPPAEDPPAEDPPAEDPPAEDPPAEDPPAEDPPVEDPPAEDPPAEDPPAEDPPAEDPPAEDPPAEDPPAEDPPAEDPPAEDPPAEDPPAEDPPAEDPPAEDPPAEDPPAEDPPAEDPPAEDPPAEDPPAEDPPAEDPPAEDPPAEDPPAEDPPAEDPPAEDPPAEDPPAEDPPAEDPPAEDPPAEDPPAEDPPAEDPPAEDPPAEDPPAEDPPAEDQEMITIIDEITKSPMAFVERRAKSIQANAEKKGIDEAWDFLGWSVIVQDISPMASARVVDTLLLLNLIDSEHEITMIVNDSPGGYCSSGFAIIDAMDYVSNPIKTVAFGMAASMGLLIFMAGNRRVIAPNATILSHRFWGVGIGSQAELEATSVEWKNLHDRIVKHYKKYSNLKSKVEIEETLLREVDTWLLPKQAVQYGLADEILSSDFEMVEQIVSSADDELGAEVKAVKVEAAKVVPYSPTIKADEDLAWSGSDAKKNLAKWASSDGSGDNDKISWSKYSKGFTWYDAENKETKGAYKLPHHDVIDSELKVVWRGVAAAMAALLGARGGTDIPDDERRGTYNHLKKHYQQFDKEVPEYTGSKDSEVVTEPQASNAEVEVEPQEDLRKIVSELGDSVEALGKALTENKPEVVTESPSTKIVVDKKMLEATIASACAEENIEKKIIAAVRKTMGRLD